LEQVLALPAPIPALSDIDPGQYGIAGDSGWHSFFLFGFGEKMEGACRICPKTAALLQAIPGLQSAFFSVLKPGKNIPVHNGVYRGFLRGHLGLIVPEGRCALRFPGEDLETTWEEGRAFVFDDSYPHEVENHLDTTRVVLLFDFRRPMGFPTRWLNRLFLRLIRRSIFVRDALANQRRWEARTLAAWEAQGKTATA
jgi:beta-hydroxylase